MNELRIAQLKDIFRIVQLVNSAYRGESSKKGWTTEADLLDGQRIDPEMLKEKIQSKDTKILVLEDEERILGCVEITKKNSQESYLGMLTIDPQEQNTGLGRKLLSMAESWIKTEWRSKQIEMTVIIDRSELIAWYERRGYQRTLETRPFPKENPKWGIPKKDLLFQVLKKDI